MENAPKVPHVRTFDWLEQSNNTQLIITGQETDRPTGLDSHEIFSGEQICRVALT